MITSPQIKKKKIENNLVFYCCNNIIIYSRDLQGLDIYFSELEKSRHQRPKNKHVFRSFVFLPQLPEDNMK